MQHIRFEYGRGAAIVLTFTADDNHKEEGVLLHAMVHQPHSSARLSPEEVIELIKALGGTLMNGAAYELANDLRQTAYRAEMARQQRGRGQ